MMLKLGKQLCCFLTQRLLLLAKFQNISSKPAVNEETLIVVCQNLTLVDEKIVETTLEEALKLSFDPTSVMVIKGKLNLKNSFK